MEGPPVRVIAEKLAFCSGQTIVSANGNTRLDISGMEGQQVMRVYSRGKNLVLQLSRCCLTIHFLMFGSYRINEQRPGMTPRLSLAFGTGTINFYACSVRILTPAEIDDLYPEYLDITSPRWDVDSVVHRCNRRTGELICDCLLDQDVFLGVGNIIKNEALFLARIHPLSVLKKIPVPHLKDLALKAVIFPCSFIGVCAGTHGWALT